MRLHDIISEQTDPIQQYQFSNNTIGAGINDVLRSGRPLSAEEKSFVSELDQAILENGKIISKIVYRGLDGSTAFSKALINNLKKGYRIQNKGYLSTTPYKSAATGIALSSEVPIYFEINPGKVKGVDLPDSGEILFGRDTTLTIISWKHETIDNEDTDQIGDGYIIVCKLS